MNVRLQYDLELPAGIYFDDRLQINQYNINMSLMTKSADPRSTNIAMDRIKAFIYGELDSTIFITEKNQQQADALSALGVNVTTLPEEPVDQIVGMMLYYKLNAIMEGRMTITQLEISSSLGDNVWYLHDEEDLSGPFASDGWWHQSTVQHETITTQPNKVVKVVPNAWIEYGLMWPEDAVPSTKSTIVYGKFTKNEN